MPLDGDALARRLAPTANLRLEFLKGVKVKDQTTYRERSKITDVKVIGGSDATVDVGDDLLGDDIRLHATLQRKMFPSRKVELGFTRATSFYETCEVNSWSTAILNKTIIFLLPAYPHFRTHSSLLPTHLDDGDIERSDVANVEFGMDVQLRLLLSTESESRSHEFVLTKIGLRKESSRSTIVIRGLRKVTSLEWRMNESSFYGYVIGQYGFGPNLFVETSTLSSFHSTTDRRPWSFYHLIKNERRNVNSPVSQRPYSRWTCCRGRDCPWTWSPSLHNITLLEIVLAFNLPRMSNNNNRIHDHLISSLAFFFTSKLSEWSKKGELCPIFFKTFPLYFHPSLFSTADRQREWARISRVWCGKGERVSLVSDSSALCYRPM